MNELLTVLFNRDNYYLYKPYINMDVLPRETKQIVHDLDEYYLTEPKVDDIDVDTFATWFLIFKHTLIKKEQADVYSAIFEAIKTTLKNGLSVAITDVVNNFIQRDFATRISDVTLRVAEGDTKHTLDECETLLDEYRRTSGKAATGEETLESSSLDELLQSQGKGLNWRLDALNKSLGPLRKGNFIVVGKLPEAGGTAFSISEACHMLEQIGDDEHILYFGNEETAQSVHRRIISSITGMHFKKDKTKTTYSVQEDPITAKAILDGSKYKNIKIHAVHGRSIQYIERVIKHYNPRLIIIDQLWKVHGFDKTASSDVSKISALFAKARELASEYAPVIAVHQADGTAYSDVYLGMEQLYMSRIGVQGEADAIVMLGVSHEAGKEDTRYINIPKNKLAGGDNSVEALRHSKWEVQIQKDISRYKD